LAVQGVPPDGAARAREPLLTILPAFGLLALVLLLGLVVPRPLGELITAAAGSVTP
jgi:hypothetical protein